MKYFLSPADPDSPMNHPWQPGFLKAHVLAAPFLVFGLGLIFRRHAMARLESGERVGRPTGRLLVMLTIPMVVSGYLVQVFTGDTLRHWSGWFHATAGLVFALGFAWHPVGKKTNPTGHDEVDVRDPEAGDPAK